ncbi:hypothetical protein ACFY7C_37055 [Streptomyces sp. NPDC012769]|uniref:hypothetical protein n=1 Tax=Streptomyces sp. NPDC012769 TaxID=3364848 RepID=UPI0036B867B9
MDTEQVPYGTWSDDEGAAPIDQDEESLAGLVLREITAYLQQAGIVDQQDLPVYQPDLNRLAWSIAQQVESHFGM